MLAFKPKREQVLGQLSTLPPFCESVRHVDLDAHAKGYLDDSCPECRRAKAWHLAIHSKF